MYYVYVIYSKSTDTFIIGQALDINEGLKKHNSSGDKNTSKGVPWILFWSTKVHNSYGADKLESKLKKLTKKKLFSYMEKYSSEFANTDD